MVGRHAVHGAVEEGVPEGDGVVGFPEGRVDPVDAVVRRQAFVGKQQVVGGDFGGEGDALVLGPPHEFDRAAGRCVADVHAVSVVAAQEGVPGHDGFLGDPRPAAQPQLGGDFAFVRDRAFGQPGVFAVLGQEHVEAFGVFDGPPHD